MGNTSKAILLYSEMMPEFREAFHQEIIGILIHKECVPLHDYFLAYCGL